MWTECPWYRVSQKKFQTNDEYAHEAERVCLSFENNKGVKELGDLDGEVTQTANIYHNHVHLLLTSGVCASADSR